MCLMAKHLIVSLIIRSIFQKLLCVKKLILISCTTTVSFPLYLLSEIYLFSFFQNKRNSFLLYACIIHEINGKTQSLTRNNTIHLDTITITLCITFRYCITISIKVSSKPVKFTLLYNVHANKRKHFFKVLLP